MDIVKAKKAMEATPEFKDYKEKLKALEEAEKVLHATPEYQALEEVCKTHREACENYRETLKCDFYAEAWGTVWTYADAQDAVEKTPELKAKEEAEEAADEAWEAVKATPEFKDYLKVVKTYEAACKKQHGEREGEA